jgi:hypothetical protein
VIRSNASMEHLRLLPGFFRCEVDVWSLDDQVNLAHERSCLGRVDFYSQVEILLCSC